MDSFQLEGVVIKFDVPAYAVMRVGFDFSHQYLSIQDYHNYEWADIDPKNVLDQTVKHLRDIKVQFYAYFNAIWG